MAFSTRLNSRRYSKISLPCKSTSPVASCKSEICRFSAIGERSASTSSINAVSSTASARSIVFISLISRSVFTNFESRSVCSFSMASSSAVSASMSGCGISSYNSSCACIIAKGVRNSCAALPLNSCKEENASESRRTMASKEWLSA